MTKYCTITEFAQKNKELGTWPHTESVIRSLRKRGATNGFSKCFITVGRRVLIDEEMFWEILESKRN